MAKSRRAFEKTNPSKQLNSEQLPSKGKRDQDSTANAHPAHLCSLPYLSSPPLTPPWGSAVHALARSEGSSVSPVVVKCVCVSSTIHRFFFSLPRLQHRPHSRRRLGDVGLHRIFDFVEFLQAFFGSRLSPLPPTHQPPSPAYWFSVERGASRDDCSGRQASLLLQVLALSTHGRVAQPESRLHVTHPERARKPREVG